jgi:hypothetical protein
MQQFRKIWDAEKNEFIKSTKGMKRYAALQAFREKYPEADCTDVAFFNQRSRLKAADNATYKGSRKPRPLYAEQEKKGYIRIKIAQPNTWVSKAKWVYMQAHPEEDYSERSNYIFLDGDTRNFDPDNIARVSLKIIGIFAQMGGTVRGNAEATRIRLAQAKLKSATYDLGEKIGTVVTVGHTRMFRKDRNEKARTYQRKAAADPERKKRRNEKAREYERQRKANDQEYREKRRTYSREWARAHRKK